MTTLVGWEGQDGFVVAPEHRYRETVLLAIAVLLLVGYGFVRLYPHHASVPPAVVYGAGATVDGVGREVTCVARTAGSCTAWAVVANGQRRAEASPLAPGSRCASAKVDQRRGRWVCAS